MVPMALGPEGPCKICDIPLGIDGKDGFDCIDITDGTDVTDEVTDVTEGVTDVIECGSGCTVEGGT